MAVQQANNFPFSLDPIVPSFSVFVSVSVSVSVQLSVDCPLGHCLTSLSGLVPGPRAPFRVPPPPSPLLFLPSPSVHVFVCVCGSIMRPTLVRFSIDFQAGRPIVFIVAVAVVVLLACHLKEIPHSSNWYVKSCVYSYLHASTS